MKSFISINHRNILINVNILFACLFFYPMVFGQANVSNIEKLSLKCGEGDMKACSKLVSIAKNDKDIIVREEAVKRLNDQSIITEIAKNDLNLKIRKIAIALLADQPTLIELAKIDKNSEIRTEAVKKITDQNVLAAIVMSDSGFVRNEAFYKISDLNLINDMARNTNDNELIKLLVYRLKDQDIIADIARRRLYDWNGVAAVNNIYVQNLLAEIACFDKDYLVRLAAFHKLDDKKLKNYVSTSFMPNALFISCDKLLANLCHDMVCNSDITWISYNEGKIKVNGERGLVFANDNNGGFIECIWCEGNKHTWIKKTGIVPYLFGQLYSDEIEPVQFVIDKKVGYVYVKGKGYLQLLNGTLIKLPLCNQKWIAKTVVNNIEYTVSFNTDVAITQIDDLKVSIGCLGTQPSYKLAGGKFEFTADQFLFDFNQELGWRFSALYNKNKDRFAAKLEINGQVECNDQSYSISEMTFDVVRKQ